jgi:hypothetical protein
MDLLGLPLTADGFLDVRVAGVICLLATQWLKRYLPDWRPTNLLALVITVAVELAATAWSGQGRWFEAVWAGLVGASLATFGYETLSNLAGWAGIGPRAGTGHEG